MKVLLLHNIATSYYKNIVYNEFYQIYKNFKVIHLAETEKIRDWKIDLSDLHYPYEVLAKGSVDNYSKLYYIKNIWNKLNEEQPDIVYLGGYFHIAYWTALVWCQIHRKKTILEMDSNRFDHDRITYKEKIKQLFVKRCNLGMTYGELSKSYFIDLGMPSKRIIIKPNVSSISLFNKSLEHSKPDCMIHKQYFIYVGRFSEEKNLLLLLESFKKAINPIKNEKWGLLLVGSGPQEIELKKYIEKNNIDNVIFSGFVDKYDLKNYYNHSTVFVLPSTREPWGLVANEAMMCGLPVVISSQCGCSLDLIDSNGYIFDPYHSQELTKILKSYINDEENILEQEAHSLKIIKKFTPKKAAECIQEAVVLLREES